MQLPDFGAWSAADFAALGSMLTAAIAIAAAIVGYFQVREARRLREEQARPFVVVDIVSAPAWLNILNLEITNISSTVAKDVRMSFDPPLVSSQKEKTIVDSLFVTRGIDTLPPGRRIHGWFDMSHERLEAGLPLRFDVTVRFKDFRGREQEPIKYVIDLEPMYGYTLFPEYGVHDVAKALREIKDLFKKHHELIKRRTP